MNRQENADVPIDPLPDKFGSDREPAHFWDTHDITNYEQFLEPVDLDANIQQRHFEIDMDEESFLTLCGVARKEQKPVKQIASEILKQKLRTG